MTIPGQDILLAREKTRFLTAVGLIRAKLQDKIRANLLTWKQGNVCMEAVSAAEDSEVEAEAEDCQDLDRRDSASESDSDARLSSQSLSKKKKKQKQTKKDKKQKKTKSRSVAKKSDLCTHLGNPLIRTQKKIIRLIANKPPRTHTAPIMQKYRLHSLTSLYILRVCAEIRPFIHPAQQQPNRPTHHHQYLRTSQLHRYPTRHSSAHQQFIPNPRSHRFSNTKAPLLTMAHLSSSYAQVWNALPEALKEEKFEETFKTKLKEHLLREQKTLIYQQKS